MERTPGSCPALSVALALAALGCGGTGPTAPLDASLQGSWMFAGFTDGGRVASTGGTWAFFEDGTLALDIEFTFPDERTNLLAAVGTYERSADVVNLEIRGGASAWTLAFAGDEVVLTQIAPDPADNTITLRRP